MSSISHGRVLRATEHVYTADPQAIAITALMETEVWCVFPCPVRTSRPLLC